MGSHSDWDVMQHVVDVLEEFGVDYDVHIISAHRTPERMFEFAKTAEKNGLSAIIAGAGGAAHLPGMTATAAIIPVIGVPIPTANLKGIDSLLSIVQMPAGIPVATVAIGKAGAINAALLAIQILALHNAGLQVKLKRYRENMAETVHASDTALIQEISRRNKGGE